MDQNYQTVLREILSYDVLCPLCIKFVSTANEVRFQYPPTSMHWSRIYEWPWCIVESNLQPNDAVLEAGGSGCVVKYAMARRCRKVVTLDNSEKNLKEAVEIQIPALRPLVHQVDKIEFVLADIRDIPFPDNTFDCTTCISTLEHTQDHKKCLSELIRVTKPGKPIMMSMDVVVNGPCNEEFSVDFSGAQKMLAEYGGVVPTEAYGGELMCRVFNKSVLACLCYKMVKE